MPINKHGIEVTKKHRTPLVCLSCPLFEDEEYDYDGQFWAAPFCRAGLFFPVKKGTCKRGERAKQDEENGNEVRS